MKRTHAEQSAGESEDEFVESSLSPREFDYEHISSRKKRRGVIEKRRRDRINHCLMELRRLVPQAISKEGSAKLEKAEILQMTVDHLRSIQMLNKDPLQSSASSVSSTWPILDAHASGFRECIDEISRYLISVEGFDVQHPLRLRLLSHLECFTERSLSPTSSSTAAPQETDPSSWTFVHQNSPSAFATPPLSSYPSAMIGYHQVYHETNATFPMHHYQQHQPPVDSSSLLPSASTSSNCF